MKTKTKIKTNSTINLLAAAITISIMTPVMAQQQKYFSSPRRYLEADGNKHAESFGGYANGRYMFFDGEQKGHTLVLRETAYRADQHIYSSVTAMGRSWNSVTLHAADGDMANTSQTFSQNYLSTPTRVFSGSVTWPSLTGKPKSDPAPWGGENGEYKFPFTQPWVYVGVKDICLDYDFSGGRLANSAPWENSKVVQYRLDGYANITHAQNVKTYYGKGSTAGGCADSATTNGSGAYGYLDANSYGPTYQIARLRSKHEIYSRSWYTAPGKPVVHMVGLGGNPLGTVFPGISCNNLYVDLNKPAVFFFKTADQTTAAYTYNSVGLIPYTKEAEGLPLWWQGAWEDSRTGQLHLTRAVGTSIPEVPPLVMRRVMFQTEPAKKALGYGPYDWSSHNPLVRYGQ